MRHLLGQLCTACLVGGAPWMPGAAAAAGLETMTVRATSEPGAFAADGVVEAVRQSVIAAQVAGSVTALEVKAGDVVRQGQVLVRVDQRSADQLAAASDAQAAAADAELVAAEREFERSQYLFEKKYISQAARDQAQAQFKAARAQARARIAQAQAAGTEASLHTLRAPYGGVLAKVEVQVGDTAAPGRALMTLYDPAALRVAVTVPETVARSMTPGMTVRIEVPGAGAPARPLTAESVTVLPAADPESHTMQVRLTLPRTVNGLNLAPGMFARAWIPASIEPDTQLMVPAAAVLRRTELRAVYVVDRNGKPSLRQVRVGQAVGEQVEILAGLEAGERVALDPLAAARR